MTGGVRRRRRWRHLVLAVAVLTVVTGAPLPPVADGLLAREASGVDRFTVTDARGGQSAPRVDGR
jgi:hypothetical protein